MHRPTSAIFLWMIGKGFCAKGPPVAVAGLLLGIVTGLLAAGLTLMLTGGLGLALLAYVGGGIAGFAGMICAGLVPRATPPRLTAQRRA